MSKAYRLSISNFLTIESLEIDLKPGVQGFVGENAAGKTNVLTAIQSILNGKHDSRLIKDGEKRSEIRLEELDGDEVVAHVSRIQTQKNSRLEGAGVSHTTPKKWLESLLDEVAINPISLIAGDPVKYLKLHLKLKIKESDAIDVPKMQIFFDDQKNPFSECQRISDDIKIARVAQYQVMRHNQELVDELRKDLPAEPEPPKQTRSELDDQKANARAKEISIEDKIKARDLLKDEIRVLENENIDLSEVIQNDQKRLDYLSNIGQEESEKFELTLRSINENHQKNLERIIAEFEESKRDLNLEYKESIATRVKNREGLNERIEANRQAMTRTISHVSKKIESLKEMNIPNLNEIEIEKQKIEKQISDLVRFDEIQKRYSNLSEKQELYSSNKDHYDQLDACFKYYAYDLPKKLIERANLPVEGLEFRDEELYVNDRHIERLSASERHRVAVDLAIALAKAKDQLCVCLDGIEIFSDDNRKELIEHLSKAGIKILYTRWGKPSGSHETEIKKV